MIKNLLSFLTKIVFWIITYLLAWHRHILNNDITPVTSQNYTSLWHPITNKLYSLNCWYYSVVYKKSCSQLMIFVSFSIEKIIIPHSYCAPLSHLTSCTPTKSNLYLANSLAAVSEPALYRLLTFHTPNLMSLFHCLGHIQVLDQVRGLMYECFLTRYVFTIRSC